MIQNLGSFYLRGKGEVKMKKQRSDVGKCGDKGANIIYLSSLE
jgi:hypothetical protein